MTRVPVRCLDWKRQLAELRPYFEGRGGVVHVHASSASPVSAFARVLRAKLAADGWPFPWSTVQIDPSDASTHYAPDIISQIRRNVELNVRPVSWSPFTISVGNENKAGGDIVVSNVDIDIAYDEYGQSALESEKIDQLCVSLKIALKTRRVGLIFVDTHKTSANNLSTLGRKLWEGALEGLTQSGLLVVDIFDPALLAGKAHAWPPDPDLILPLPDRYDDQSRTHALDDLAAIALAEGWFATSEEAHAFGRTILATSDDVRDVYARLARAVAGLGTAGRLCPGPVHCAATWPSSSTGARRSNPLSCSFPPLRGLPTTSPSTCLSLLALKALGSSLLPCSYAISSLNGTASGASLPRCASTSSSD